MFGGGMIGLQYAAVKQQLGPLLNGIVYWDVYVPEPTMDFPGIKDFLRRYQERAAAAGAALPRVSTPPYAFARPTGLSGPSRWLKMVYRNAISAHLHPPALTTLVGDFSFFS